MKYSTRSGGGQLMLSLLVGLALAALLPASASAGDYRGKLRGLHGFSSAGHLLYGPKVGTHRGHHPGSRRAKHFRHHGKRGHHFGHSRGLHRGHGRGLKLGHSGRHRGHRAIHHSSHGSAIFFCASCNHHFRARSDFHDHLRDRHDVARRSIPHVIVLTDVGFAFFD